MDKRLDRLIMVALALALGYFALDKFVMDPIRDEAKIAGARQEGRSEALVESYGEQSIAVLAFEDMSPGNDQEYLSDGIAEELLNLLAGIPELRVVSRSSAFSLKGMNLGIPEIAKRLNVAHVLEGSVRKDGNKVRITTQLIEAHSDTHLWSENYDRTLDDIFAIQDEIAASVVEQLKITLLGKPPKAEQYDPEAYALVLQARHLSHQNNAKASEQSTALLKRALTIDPNIPRAWFLLSMNYQNSVSMGLRSLDEAYALSLDALHKAIAINPEYVAAVGDLGWVEMMYRGDLGAAAMHYKRALSLDPSDQTSIDNGAVLLERLGRLDEAIEIYEWSALHTPDHPILYLNLGWFYLNADLPDKAIASAQTALMLSPDMHGPDSLFGHALIAKGENQLALEAVQDASVVTKLLVKVTHHNLNEYPASDDALAELIENHNDHPAAIASVLAYRGELDLAFEWLYRAAQQIYNVGGVSTDPDFTNLHEDSRWLPFLESIGQSPQQLAAIDFSIDLPEESNSN
jgi:TolB-like protein/predicted Zn-dependent protease